MTVVVFMTVCLPPFVWQNITCHSLATHVFMYMQTYVCVCKYFIANERSFFHSATCYFAFIHLSLVALYERLSTVARWHATRTCVMTTNQHTRKQSKPHERKAFVNEVVHICHIKQDKHNNTNKNNSRAYHTLFFLSVTTNLGFCSIQFMPAQ